MGSKRTHDEARRRLRRRLERQGLPAEAIAKRVDDLRRRQQEGRDARRQFQGRATRVPLPGAEREAEALQEETYRRLSPDDRGYRPKRQDPLKVGAARVSGIAARAVGRGHAITKWQYDEMQAKEG